MNDGRGGVVQNYICPVTNLAFSPVIKTLALMKMYEFNGTRAQEIRIFYTKSACSDVVKSHGGIRRRIPSG